MITFSSIVIDCGLLDDPEFGMVSVSNTTYTSVANYSCSIGHNLTVGNVVRTCQISGLWSGSEPNCTGEMFIVVRHEHFFIIKIHSKP